MCLARIPLLSSPMIGASSPRARPASTAPPMLRRTAIPCARPRTSSRTNTRCPTPHSAGPGGRNTCASSRNRLRPRVPRICPCPHRTCATSPRAHPSSAPWMARMHVVVAVMGMRVARTSCNSTQVARRPCRARSGSGLKTRRRRRSRATWARRRSRLRTQLFWEEGGTSLHDVQVPGVLI